MGCRGGGGRTGRKEREHPGTGTWSSASLQGPRARLGGQPLRPQLGQPRTRAPVPHSCRAGGRGEARAAAPGKCRALLGLQPQATAPSSPRPPCTTTTVGPMPRGHFPWPPAQLVPDTSEGTVPRAQRHVNPHAPAAPRHSARPQHRPWPKRHSLVPKQSRCLPRAPPGAARWAQQQPCPQRPDRTPPAHPLAPSRCLCASALGREGDVETWDTNPSLPFLPWPLGTPPRPPPRHPARVPGVSHGSHPGGLPRPPPAARGQAACRSARPAPTGRAAEPAERAGADAAVGAKQRPGGGGALLPSRLLKPRKKGEKLELGAGGWPQPELPGPWAATALCDPRTLGARWGAQAEPLTQHRSLAPMHGPVRPRSP